MARTTFSGPVASDNGFIGDVTGDVTAVDITATGNADLQGSANIIVLPTSDPGVANAIWINAGNIDVSAG